MNSNIALLMQRMEALELELEAEMAKRHAELRIGFEKGRVAFEEEVRRRHQELKTHVLTYMRNARPFVVLTAPLIYALLIPLALLDVSVFIFQAICFRAYGIERARRRDYFVFDRHYLGYLNALEKLNCAYCSYANGAIAFMREVAARTEAHWCPIKHARRIMGAHERYREFLEFGDADAYRAWLAKFSKDGTSRPNEPTVPKQVPPN